MWLPKALRNKYILPRPTLDVSTESEWIEVENNTINKMRVKRVFKFEDFRKVVAEMNAKGFTELRNSLRPEDYEAKKMISELGSCIWNNERIDSIMLRHASTLSMEFLKFNNIYEERN